MWREKREGSSSLHRREPFGAIAICGRLRGNDGKMRALAAAFEEAWLKNIG